MDKVTTPDPKNKYFKLLMNKLTLSNHYYVDYEPDEGVKPLDCFPSVAKRVEEEGGRMIYGWQAWESYILVEAEAHAIWEKPNGAKVDITPKAHNVNLKSILFIPDSNLAYDNKQIDNVRINKKGWKTIDDFIEIAEILFYFYNKGNRANLYGREFSASLNPDQKKLYLDIEYHKNSLWQFIRNRKTILALCFCGKKLAYNKCHGHKSYLDNLREKVRLT